MHRPTLILMCESMTTRIAPIEGLDGVRHPPDPLHYCNGLSAVRDSFFDAPVGRHDEQLLEM